MVLAYLNYPNSRVSLHRESTCSRIQQARKAGQRRVRVGPKHITTELGRFKDGHYRFASQADTNDMWLEIDFSDVAFELAVARHIHNLLGNRYKRFRDCSPEDHC